MIKYSTFKLKSQQNPKAIYHGKLLRLGIFKFQIITFKNKIDITFNINNWDK